MESRDGMISHTIFRDIARMDKPQLDKYTRMAFTGKSDKKFLPEPFWDYWFDGDKHGGPGMDGRTPPSPAHFLSGVHNMIAGTKAGVFTVGSNTDEQPNFEFRSTYRAVIQGILDECIALPGEPTDEQKRLASFAVEAVGRLQPPETFNRDYRERVAARRGGKEGSPIAEDYPAELKTDLDAQTSEQILMMEKVQQLVDSEKFGALPLHYKEY